jgi:hypothetical protein
MPKWPPAFARIAEIIGDEAAIKVCRFYGGVELSVPKNPKPGLRLVELIGLAAAEKLAKEWGCGKISPPLMKGALVRPEIAAASGSLTEIARRFGVTRRFVSGVKNGTM